MDFAQQVKAQVDIVRTVEEYGIRLRRMGTRHVGLCPFHTEKTPSFGVNPNLGLYKCFGCGAGGDVIKFVQEIEGLTFWEALKSLAERNGIPIPQRADRDDPDTELRAALFDMYEAASVHYAQNLSGAAGAEARDYLQKRGLNPATVSQFLLGYSEASWDGLLRRFGKRYSPAAMEASGLFGKRDEGGLYDRFRGRLMFPIHNETGKVIAFGGRAVKSGDEPKYLNSPETTIYKKSMVLYNLHRAKDTIRRGGRTILVEGYMDVIGVYSAGVRNVVASCGTALTSQQVRAMKRFSDQIVVNFDPDNAGANATERSIQMLLDESMHVRVLELAQGLDPDEFIKERGAEEYQTRLDRATNYFIWLADRARRKFGGGTAEDRMAGYEALLLPAIRRISGHLERAAVASEVADYLALDRALVLAEFRKIPGERQTVKTNTHTTPTHTMPQRERIVIRTLVEDPEIRDFLLPRLAGFATPRQFSVWPAIETMMSLTEEQTTFSYQDLEARLDENTKTLMSSAIFADHSGEVFTREQAELFLTQLESEERQLRYSDVERQVKAAERAGNMDEAMRLMQIAGELKRQIRTSTV